MRGIVNLYERRRVRLFVRRDSYERFYSCLVYVPRDRYNTEVRERIERIVRAALRRHARRIPGADLRLHAGAPAPAGAHAAGRARRSTTSPAIEAEIAAAAATWEDRLQQALIARGVERERRRTRDALRAHVSAGLSRRRRARAGARRHRRSRSARGRSRRAADSTCARGRVRPASRLHLRILQAGDPISISDILPMLENFGLRVLAEHPYQVARPSAAVWIQDFELEARDLKRADIAALEPLFKEAFLAAWRGEVENDGFNRLLLCAGLSAREIVVLRAYCRYLLQTGIPFSQAYMERVLVAQAPIAAALVRLFQTQFALDGKAREARRASASAKAILRALDKVASLDEDRILRATYRDPRDAAHQLLSDHGRPTERAEELGVVQARSARHSRPAAAAAEVRDLRLQPARRGRAPAHGLRGARRHALVGPARRLPHRSARAS